MSAGGEEAAFIPVAIAVLTVSDTRNEETDTSGRLLVERLQAAGHRLSDKVIIPVYHYLLRAQVSRWIADPAVQAVIVTGGTGLTARGQAPGAGRPRRGGGSGGGGGRGR